jgi:hypothetical protein
LLRTDWLSSVGIKTPDFSLPPQFYLVIFGYGMVKHVKLPVTTTGCIFMQLTSYLHITIPTGYPPSTVFHAHTFCSPCHCSMIILSAGHTQKLHFLSHLDKHNPPLPCRLYWQNILSACSFPCIRLNRFCDGCKKPEANVSRQFIMGKSCTNESDTN